MELNNTHSNNAHIWQVQEAKMRLSELIRQAAKRPQLITVRGEETAVMLSKKQYDKLTHPQLSITEIMQKSPHKKAKINFTRSKDKKSRKIDL